MTLIIYYAEKIPPKGKLITNISNIDKIAAKSFESV